jgi:GNAT superfamily N-acetyltransferase
MLWLGFTERSDGLVAFGYDFLVTSDRRRQGYGWAIMEAAEQVCRDRGVVEVGLSVFGFNSGARALYEQMGFEVTILQMRKRL